MLIRKTLWIAIAAALSLVAADRPRETKLQQAMDLMETKGDLPGAIKLLEDVAKSPDRNLAARGLLYLGDCRDKLGQKESRTSYERIVREFADQKEVVAEANRRLAAIAGPAGSRKTTTERVSDIDWDTFNVALDRPLYTTTDWVTGDLMLHNPITGEVRNLTRNDPAKKPKEWAQTSLISADGEMVLYGVDGGGGGNQWSEIHSIHTDGSGLRTHLRRTERSEYLSPFALSPDKKTAIIAVGGLIEILSLADNSLKPLDNDLRLRFPEGYFSPDSKQVVLSGKKGNEDSGLLVAGIQGGGARSLLAEKVTTPLWTPDGKWIVFISDRTGPKAIWAIPASGGTPRLLKEEQGISELHGFGRDGSLYYSTTVSQSDIHVAQLDSVTLALKGEPSQLINTFLGRNRLLSFSPDGKWAVWLSARRQGQMQSAILRSTTGGEEKEMTWITATGGVRPRMWFPDSKAVLNLRQPEGQSVFERVEVADGRATELYRGPTVQFTPIGAMPAGNAVLGYRCYGSTPKPCELLRLEANAVSVAETLSDFAQIRDMSLSPDGKWLAISGKLSSSPQALFIRPVAGGKLVELYRESQTEGIQIQNAIVWTSDSKNIIVAITTAERGSWGAHEFRAIPVEGGAAKIIPLKGSAPALAPDWRLAYTVGSGRSELWVARNLLPKN